MSTPDPTAVTVTLTAQQLELLERLCAEQGFASPADALRHGLAAYLAQAS